MRVYQVCMLLAALCCAVESKTLIFENKMRNTIWVGSLGNHGKPTIENGGWKMDAWTQRVINVADDWAGRFWARTGCRFDAAGNGPCETGDCGNRLLCRGNGGRPPVSLAEFTFGGQDFYDISLVDGYNVPATITPTDKFGGGDKYKCTAATCPSYAINSYCPPELRLMEGGRTVGCKSACLAFKTDQYCCHGAYNTPDKCVASTWAVNYPAFFKKHCPLAYSYAYDDQKSTFTCDRTGYRITFG